MVVLAIGRRRREPRAPFAEGHVVGSVTKGPCGRGHPGRGAIGVGPPRSSSKALMTARPIRERSAGPPASMRLMVFTPQGLLFGLRHARPSHGKPSLDNASAYV
jgi:hypothetical protein